MSVWKGVTDFLESVDQKAGEIVERQRHGAEYEEDEEVEEDEEEEFSLGEEPQQHPHRPQSSSSSVAANAAPVVPQGAGGGGDGSHNGFPSPPTGSTTSSSNGRRSTPAAAVPTADPTTGAADKDAATTLLKKQERHYEDLLHDRQQRFDVLQQDYERLRHRQSETESKLNQTLTRYHDTQQQLEILQHQQQSTDEARSRLEQEVALLEQDNANLQSQLQQQRSTEQTLKDQTARSEYRLTELAKELSEYQTKSRILVDERDRQIEMLQAAAAASSGSSSPTTGPPSTNIILTEDERQRWIAEIADLKANLHQLEADAASFQQTRSRLSGQVGALEVERDRVKQNLDISQSEVQSWKEVYESERNTHASTRRALTDAQAEIDDLRRQTEKWKNAAHAAGPTGSSAGALQGDQEVRLKELAALVMEKQSALEAKRSEAEQWRTRYELAQQRLREAEAVGLSLSQAASSAVASTSLSNGSARIPVYDATTTGRRGATGPSDYGEEDIDKSRLITGLAKQGAWGKRAAEVAKGIDRVSLQTGSVLKRHAMLRVAITGYVFLLHVWVFFAVTLAGGSMGSERDGPKM